MLVEPREPVGEVARDDLDPRQAQGIEAAREGRLGGPARHHEDRVVLVHGALGAAAQGPADLARVHAVRQRERADLVLGHVALDPLLRLGDLHAHDRLVVLAEVGVPERVVADLVAVAHEVLQLPALVLRLVEEAIGLAGAGQHVERGGATEVRLFAQERLEDSHRALRVDLQRAVGLDVAELPRRGVVEGEHDRRRPGRRHDAAVEQRVQRVQAVAPRVERLEVLSKVLGCARPAVLGIVDLVVLEDHQPPELVGGGLIGPGEGGEHQRGGQEQDGDECQPHRAASGILARSAPPV